MKLMSNCSEWNDELSLEIVDDFGDALKEGNAKAVPLNRYKINVSLELSEEAENKESAENKVRKLLSFYQPSTIKINKIERVKK